MFDGLKPAVLLILALAGSHVPAHAAGIETFTTPAGIEVWLKNEPSIPILSLDFAFRGGASLDPADQPAHHHHRQHLQTSPSP